jgi:hypothetical protein
VPCLSWTVLILILCVAYPSPDLCNAYNTWRNKYTRNLSPGGMYRVIALKRTCTLTTPPTHTHTYTPPGGCIRYRVALIKCCSLSKTASSHRATATARTCSGRKCLIKFTSRRLEQNRHSNVSVHPPLPPPPPLPPSSRLSLTLALAISVSLPRLCPV